MIIDKNQTIELKGIAVLLLLFHHFFYNSNVVLVNDIARYSKITVGIFVFLSGYGLSASYSNYTNSSCAFFLKNIKKLYTSYCPVFFISILIGYLLNLRNIYLLYNGNILKIVFDFFGISYLVYGETFNATWWYMSLIIILYLIHNIFYNIFFVLKNKIFAICTVLFILRIIPLIIKSKLLTNIYKVTYSLDYVVVFLIGIITYINRDKIQNKIEENKFMLGFLFVIVSLIRMNKVFVLGTKLDFLIVFLLCGIYIENYSYIKNKKQVKSIISLLGLYSFEIFLTHTFIYYYYFPNYVNISNYLFVNFIWFIFLSIILAIIIRYILNNLLKIKVKYEK